MEIFKRDEVGKCRVVNCEGARWNANFKEREKGRHAGMLHGTDCHRCVGKQ